ncbi:putative 2-keto-3-deoxy-galactonate aldolase YagE [Pseudobythopirellula maris]|uniref:Putative 2-keto-3-deoxy-galactonate aldolase YagE n=1 Tax=Pseudobythopirellula maris TaxID=2527991 RepID=A0A5C5ZXR9_9BACT|nr:dihydrodipicolinate synthase family protein [Pseudobythopirellula maris]TWT91063.1 putative 2-keto-3-deoxy-galactonate aldolase YagE [Pseudobythopirellula maris]
MSATLNKVQGVIVPLVTPLAAADEIDAPGLGRLVERLLVGRVHGLFVCGTTGEGPSLSYRTRRELVELVCQQASGRAPVLVGVTDTSLIESVEMAAFAHEAGADAVVLAPPCYFPIDQQGLIQWAHRLVEETPLPVMLYNMPALTKTNFEPDTVIRLMEEPQIIGLKDSSGDMDYFEHMRGITRARPDFSLLTGPEHLLGRSVAMGGDGGVCGGANITPSLFVELYEAACAGDAPRVALAEERVRQLAALYRIGTNPSISVIQGVKAALGQLGVCSDRMAEPYEGLCLSGKEQVRTILDSLTLDPESAASGVRATV